MDWLRRCIDLLSRLVSTTALSEHATREALSFVGSELSLVRGADEEVDRLLRHANRIRSLLSDAEDRRYIDDASVKQWLSDLRAVLFDADDLLDLHRTLFLLPDLNPSRKRRRSWLVLDRPLSRREIGIRVAKIHRRLEEIAEGRKNYCLRPGDGWRRSPVGERRRLYQPLSSSSGERACVIGREVERARIVQELISDFRMDVPVLPIYGTAGIGKTTLAQLVFHDGHVVGYFGLRIWVSLCEGYDVRRATKETIEAITRSKCDLLSLDILQHRLGELLRKNRFLLVLDNLWAEDSQFWETFRLPLLTGESESKVMITTRSEKVWKRMQTTISPICLMGLGEKECWTLLRDRTFPQGASEQHGGLVEIGMKIAKKCKGSPMAAKSLGDLLRDSMDKEEWTIILSEMAVLEKDPNRWVLPSLQISYHHLPFHLKQCFAYCSVFPNGYELEKDEVVRLWMAEGLIEHDGSRRLEAIGGRYFDDLLQRAFFGVCRDCQQGKQKHQIPSLMHELARLVAKSEFLRLENEISNVQPKQVRYATLYHLDQKPLAFDKLYECENLRTLKLSGEIRVPLKQVPKELFLKLSRLRALDLSNSEVKDLPDFVGDLIHLRYLGLSNTEIEKLPNSVTNLYNLLTLELNECNKLLELPQGASKLVNLHHIGLHLDWDNITDLTSMPPGIDKLTSLQTLSRFVVTSNSKSNIGELRNLNLRGELCISKLENVIDSNDAEDANLRGKEYINNLMLRWTGKDYTFEEVNTSDKVIKSLHPNSKLKYLRIENYPGRGLPDWIEDHSFSHLDTLRLYHCKNCKLLPLLGKLPRLKNLQLQGMHGLQSLGTSVGFPSLEILVLRDMRNLERWFENEEGAIPKLRELSISDCPNLLELTYLPSRLIKLELRNCNKLSSIPALPPFCHLVTQ